MNSTITLNIWLLLLLVASIFAKDNNLTDDQIIAKVQQTVIAIQKDAPWTFRQICAGQPPFRDAQNKSFYSFVYDTQVKMIAHPDVDLVGKSFKGKSDVRGKLFRDEIVRIALEKGRGWVDYHYRKPGEIGIFLKTTYFEKVIGSDGKTYIVACGRYK